MPRPLLALLCLAACGSADDASPQAAIRGFVGAVARDDLDRARGYLPTAEACDRAPALLVDRCKEGAAEMRTRVDGWKGELPADAKVVGIAKADVPTPDPAFAVWTVTIEAEGDRDDLELFTMQLGGRAYVGFPIKRRSSP
jgi:hypothetical protein